MHVALHTSCVIGKLVGGMLQDRAQAVKTQLVNTMQELEELKARQQHLESKNFLLEKLQTMHESESMQHVTSEVSPLLQVAILSTASTCFYTTLVGHWQALVVCTTLAIGYDAYALLVQADVGRHRFGDYEASNTAHGRGVVLTIQGHVQSISVQTLVNMELPDFARLWTVQCFSMLSSVHSFF